jgi:hypothetical protein
MYDYSGSQKGPGIGHVIFTNPDIERLFPSTFYSIKEEAGLDDSNLKQDGRFAETSHTPHNTFIRTPFLII